MAPRGALAAVCVATAAVAACAGPLDPPFRGVNLGGWFVLESWIYPNWWANVTGGSVPDGVGEWQFCQILGAERARAALTAHWDTWVTVGDLAALAAVGVTHVRVPIGYWILGAPYIYPGEPFLAGGWPYLVRALGWMKSLGLHAIIDLHGAPGSQNGHDNSGRSGDIEWNTPENVSRTITVLQALAANLTALNANEEYSGVVVGIEVLNEPWTTAVNGPITFDLLKAFVQNATDAILATGFQGMIWFPDGWQLSWPGWVGFLSPPQYENIFIDSHLYHCFGGYDQLTRWGQSNYTCAVDYPRLAGQTSTDWVVVGEYSLCIPDSPPQPYTIDDVMMYRAYAEAQMQAFGAVGDTSRPAKGAFFWNFKTEAGVSEWDYLGGVGAGTVPDLAKPRTASAFDCLSI